LIRYERDKRTFYGFEDAVWQLLRGEIRQLQANRFTFELGRELIRNSAAQIELNADQRALNEARGRSQGPQSARDNIQALQALLDAQNGLLGIFVNYEIVRRGLELDLGTMELTPEGLWIDPGKLTPNTLLALPGTTAYGMIECDCSSCGLKYNPLPAEPEPGSWVPLDNHGIGEEFEVLPPLESADQVPENYPTPVPAPVRVDDSHQEIEELPSLPPQTDPGNRDLSWLGSGLIE
jgi:hypothetical protein